MQVYKLLWMQNNFCVNLEFKIDEKGNAIYVSGS